MEKSPHNPLCLSHYITHWESLQKLFHKWYFTPDRLARIYPSTSPKCWRGCDNTGSLSHIWWDFPPIKSYWKKVMKQIFSSCDITIPMSPLDLLLGFLIPTWPRHLQALVTHILIAARLAVAKMEIKPPSTPKRRHSVTQLAFPNGILVCQSQYIYKTLCHNLEKMDHWPQKHALVLNNTYWTYPTQWIPN